MKITVQFILFILLLSSYALASNEQVNDINKHNSINIQVQTPTHVNNETYQTLESLVKQKTILESEIQHLKKEIESNKLTEEKKELNGQLQSLKEELANTQKYLSEIAAGTDISSLSKQEEEAFNFTKEVLALIKPIVDEVKSMTSDIRQKSSLKDKIHYLNIRLPILEEALTNLKNIKNSSDNKEINTALSDIEKNWQKQQSLMRSEYQAAQLQLNKIIAQENSDKASTASWAKQFFQKRGLYLGVAILVVIIILVLSKGSYSAMQKYLPGFKAKHRVFRIRFIELLHRVFTILLMIIGPMIVFYLVEDWVLFSLGLLLLIGIGWTLREAIPHYWSQIYLFLNMGSVREGERIDLDGLPWLVEKINVYCCLINPTANLEIRIPIKDMVGKISRPYDKGELWFPCRNGDWVLLSDGIRGMVNSISQEMVQLIQRGGARKTYSMSDFIAQSPLNLSITFRLKETIGISYNLQSESTHKIPDILAEFIHNKANEEGYGDDLISLKVEFEYANTSSLDIVVIADFNGQLADLYNRLRRRIQRWCVEACTEYNWEIPFQQITIHKV
ncbi:MAG: hypothetical protein HQL46_01240 [Gammaproteobacteria bacterium]|nr:hypothetical protein [Gammaproteobacteria bacterium]